ncbi:LysR substrate-binding domain-containing protein [Streptomyces tubercidicus]|uniref:LysR substrate-binding domain-containing protein n=1 Tax=Streptomyces tubercidicus TaxID=47759 RepID=UPI003465FEC1
MSPEAPGAKCREKSGCGPRDGGLRCRSRGVEPDIRYLLAEHATQLALVARNLTASLVPAMSGRPAPPGVRLLATRPALRRDIRAAWLTRAESPPVRACVAAVEAHCRSTDEGPPAEGRAPVPAVPEPGGGLKGTQDMPPTA